MAVAGFALSVLSITLFWWLGVTLGGIWSAGQSVDAALSGNPAGFSTQPFWILGIGMGVALPALSAVLSGIGMVRGSKGVGLAGTVMGTVAALLGLGFTLFTVFTLNMVEQAGSQEDLPAPSEAAKQMQNTLDDPAFQDQIMKAMAAAAQKGSPLADAGVIEESKKSSAPAESTSGNADTSKQQKE